MVRLRQVEEQDFRALHAFDGELLLVTDGGAVTLLQRFSVELHRTAGYLQPAVASVRQGMRDLLLWLEQRDVQACVLVDGDRALPPIGRSDHAQFAKLLLARERLL